MMTTIFRVILVVVSVFTMAFMMRKIRQAKIQIEAALFWVIIALVLVVFSICPPVADACAKLLGIYSTANFLFLFMIFILMIKVFTLTLQVSQLESKQKELVQKMALDQLEREQREAAGPGLAAGRETTGEQGTVGGPRQETTGEQGTADGPRPEEPAEEKDAGAKNEA